MCGKQPNMQPPAAFMLFQNAASLHAEAIGNGTAALAERDCYWVATHSKIDFYNDANLLDMLTVSTWVNPAKPNAVRGYRGYDIFVGDKQIAEGLTELGRSETAKRASSAFPSSGSPRALSFRTTLPAAASSAASAMSLPMTTRSIPSPCAHQVLI